MPFDPDAAAQPGAGIFGLPENAADAGVVLVPVPFDATTSYRRGTAGGPRAVFEASMQVDLFDPRLGRVYERGIVMQPEDAKIRRANAEARRAADPIIARGGVEPDAPVPASVRRSLAKVNAACERVNEIVDARVSEILEAGRVPGVLGGEHSVPFGAIRAVARRFPGVGILHVDAHMDLREAFEGFAWSHASIMHNVLTRLAGVAHVVQVGIRDFGERERAFALEQGSRVRVWYDHELAEALLEGERWSVLAAKIIRSLPRQVYVSFDIDALDPSLCPHTGTPVPGGLSFHQASLLLEALRASGRTVVGFDLVEVAPGAKGSPEWDANVGARVLYKLCGLAGSVEPTGRRRAGGRPAR
ncbi:MAG: agmatinase family protein [Planctomycetota bacterium]|nr:agmatinase family protein [Planctomycetota bacterium]